MDRLHLLLGLSAFPRWEEAFATLWSVLAPGGRCVVVDVHADPLSFQGRMVNLCGARGHSPRHLDDAGETR